MTIREIELNNFRIYKGKNKTLIPQHYYKIFFLST